MNEKRSHYPIAEIFTSLQGEGLYTGAPSLFIRFSGCNMRCWWCDTPYTSWRPEGEMKDLCQLEAAIVEAKVSHVVLTGGEPTLFPDALEVLCARAKKENKLVTIETNGTRYLYKVKPDLWSVSPKLKSSAPKQGQWREEHLKLVNEVHYKDFLYGESARQFKFVVETQQDLEEVEKIVKENKLPPNTVWLMPQCRSIGAFQRVGPEIAAWCKERNWNFSPRLHILLWGNVRGV